MSKQSIILLVIAIILVIGAAIFCVSSFLVKSDTVNQNNNTVNAEDSNNVLTEVENSSNTIYDLSSNETNIFDSSKSTNLDTTNYINNENLNSNEIVNQMLDDVDDIARSTSVRQSSTEDFETTYDDFTVFDKNQNKIKLSDYSGKEIFLMFWSSSNEDSVQNLKEIEKLYSKYKDQVQFLVICTDMSANDDVISNLSFPIYYDLNKDAANKLNVETLPTFIYITGNNEIFNAKTGYTNADALDANLEILSEKLY